MKEKKTEQLTAKTTRNVYDRVVELARKGHRPVSLQIELLILEHPKFADLKKKIMGENSK